eukprot:CAMPEP_0171416752 /NCGR_PEP_ID=MMETSP0880-20121228/40254_1 /TAXON_ID=67004 /ORGANISM="Thalassiosira weissflogii, Strain CCMP1336" /LENGTH=1064 /DNA_ID=CAMNT_0011935007 /DNA_START=483 /DNA_END=3678 /DNA_ORIENTATION=-
MTTSLSSFSKRQNGKHGGEINPRGKISLQQKSFALLVNTFGAMSTIFAISLAFSSSSMAAAQPRKGAGNSKYQREHQQHPHDSDNRFVQDSFHYMELTNHAMTKSRNRYLLTINEIFGDTSASASTNSTPLSDDLYQKCLSDLQLVDADFDSRLSNSEFVDFINLNSYSFYDADTMNELPLNFPLLFHSTACLCTLKEDITAEEAEDCCAGSNGHIEIYGGGNSTNATTPATMNEEEDAYMRGFCTEAWYSYGATMHPTRSPVVSTDSPTASPTEGGTTVVPTVLPTTVPPVMPSTSTPTAIATPVNSTSARHAYMRGFCTEAWYSYGATMHPTRSPVVATDGPTASPTGGGTTVAPTVLPTTLPPAMPSTSTPTAIATPNGTTTTTTTSPNAPPVNSTSAPTATEPGIPTKTPSTIATASPVAVPTKAPSSTTTLSPTAVSSTLPPAIPPATPSPIMTATSSPTRSPSSDTSSPSGGGGGAVLPIGIQYGISSNCGVTAQDVLNETNNTVKYGLESATTAVLIGILNETYPRTEERASGRSGNYDSDDGNSGSSSGNGSNSEVIASGVRVQVPNGRYKLFQESVRNENDEERHRSRLLKNNGRHARKLVYYTDEHPVIITDVEDVVDQACPPGQNCMRVMSTVLVVLEEGDDPEEIAQVVRLRIEQSFNDGSFFESIPPDTIFCPGDTVPPSPATTGSPTLPPVPSTSNTPTRSPSMDATSSPTLPPVPLSTGTPTQAPSVPTTSSPTLPPIPASTGTPTASPTTIRITGTPTASPSVGITSTPTSPPVTMAPTVSPTARVTTAPTTSPVSVGTSSPTQSPMGSSVSETPTPAPTPGSTGSPPASMDPLRIQITYDIANDCGLDAEAVFNGDGTTLKTGLEAATATTTIGILNATFPRTDAPGKRKTRNRARRQLSEHSSSNLIQPHDIILGVPSHTSRRQRRLVYYTEEYPVTIDRIIDITTDCAPGNNCLLIISTITVLPEAGDDLDAISSAIENGMKESFDDGTFFGNIPEDTVVCPARRNMQKVMNDGGEVVMARSSRGNEAVGSLDGRARLLKFVASR